MKDLEEITCGLEANGRPHHQCDCKTIPKCYDSRPCAQKIVDSAGKQYCNYLPSVPKTYE